MIKLTLRERLKYWRETKTWLKPLKWRNDKDDEIFFYEGIKKGEENTSIWILDGRERLTKISEDLRNCYRDFFLEGEQGSYFMGTEGIFYKKPKEPLKMVYWRKDFKEISSFRELGIVCIIKNNGADIIARLKDGEFFEIMQGKVVCINSKNVGCWAWENESEKSLNIIMKEGSQYVCHMVDEDGEIHRNRFFSSNFTELFKLVMM